MFSRDSRGQILPLFVLSAVVLLAFMGLGLDGARAFVERRQAQGAADLASLAGARNLPDSPSQAIADALALALANGYEAGDVTVTTPYLGDPGRIKVVIDSGVQLLFMPILGMSSMEVDASATALREPPVTGAAVPLTGPAILAQLNLCGSAGNDVLKWSGATATINGDVITNSGGDISGSGNLMNGTETYYDNPPTCDNQFTPHSSPNPPTNFVPVTTLTSFPLDPSVGALADPIGAGICDHYVVADIIPSDATTKQIANGVWCRVNNATTPTAIASKINLKTNTMWCDYCTFIALDFQASGTAVTITSPAITVDASGNVCDIQAELPNTCGGYPLLIYSKGCPTTAACTPDPKAGVNWSGANAVWNGLIFTPTGLSYVSGKDSGIYNGAVWGREVEVSGGGFTLNGPTEWDVGGSGTPLPEVLALVE